MEPVPRHILPDVFDRAERYLDATEEQFDIEMGLRRLKAWKAGRDNVWPVDSEQSGARIGPNPGGGSRGAVESNSDLGDLVDQGAHAVSVETVTGRKRRQLAVVHSIERLREVAAVGVAVLILVTAGFIASKRESAPMPLLPPLQPGLSVPGVGNPSTIPSLGNNPPAESGPASAGTPAGRWFSAEETWVTLQLDPAGTFRREDPMSGDVTGSYTVNGRTIAFTVKGNNAGTGMWSMADQTIEWTRPGMKMELYARSS